MKRLLFVILAISIITSIKSQTFSAFGEFEETTPDASTQLSTIYIFKSLTGATITYHSTTGNSIKIFKYKSSQNDKDIISDNDIKAEGTSTYTVSNLQDGYGYLFEDAGLAYPRAVWVFDYQSHQPVINSIEVIDSEFKCELVDLSISKSDIMTYYGIQGQARNVERRYDILYQTMKWNETNNKFEEYTENQYNNKLIGTDFQVAPPLMDTEFTISGDQFGKAFDMSVAASSHKYTAISSEAHIIAEQEYRESSNEIDEPTNDLGGSAPASINFYGFANEPVARFFTWYIYNSSDLQNPLVRYTDRDIKYRFEQWGNYKVVLETTDQTATCISRDSVEFKITESMLDVPNFFSPGDSPGINDEFRVAYKSLTTFKCTIFNRWGTKLYEFRDPAKGWDGRYKGKLVNPGVYFYVIEAKGADGEVYKKKGDINIVRSK